MCGFIGFFGNNAENRICVSMIKGIYERGETTESFSTRRLDAVVRRLKIVDRDNAVQPFRSSDERYDLIFNGEIFNFKELQKSHLTDYPLTTHSDTEVLMALLIRYQKEALKLLNGQFAFVFFDLEKDSFLAGRDHIGISPLYYLQDEEGIYFSSTIKCLVPFGRKIQSLALGSILTNEGLESYYKPTVQIIPKDQDRVLEEVHREIKEAVLRRIDTDLPIAVIYSGGIDSTIVLHLACQHHADVTAFTIGKEGSEDFEISKRFCKERNIRQITLPLKSRDLSVRQVREAIKATELTEYLDIINGVLTMSLFREIQRHGIKISLSGDGSDELFGGYDMYETIGEKDSNDLFEYKLNHLNRTELQRVDRTAGSFRVENRVPFLDIKVINTALSLEKKWKIHRGVEKWCVRKAFEKELPEYILLRRKNPLSHSSGLHESIRYKQLFFKGYYNSFNFNLHDSLRRDFSITLRKNNYIMAEATKDAQIYQDYSMGHKLGEFLKGFIRFHIVSPNFIRKGNVQLNPSE
jgi:asparagine synthase (glutamine-hydrolysing)